MEYDTKGMQRALANWNHKNNCVFLHLTHGGEHDLGDCSLDDHFMQEAAWQIAAMVPAMTRDVVIPTRKDEDARIATRIRAELVCCDITERMDAEAAKGRWDDETHQYLMPKSWRDLKRSPDFHPICFYGGWAAQISRAGVGRRYWCSQGGQMELNEGGGFQTCCNDTEGHIHVDMGPEREGDD